MNDARKEIFDTWSSLSESAGGFLMAEDIALFKPFDDAIQPALKIAQAKSARVPNYPFKDDWYAMSLKQLLKDAIDEGADAISVSTSAPIKARYTDEYSKFYETLYDQKIPSAMKKLANKYGGKFEKGDLDFENTLGTADMNQITNRPGFENPDDVYKILETNIIRITPEMKKKILEEGLPSFAFGGPVNRLENLVDINSINIFED